MRPDRWGTGAAFKPDWLCKIPALSMKCMQSRPCESRQTLCGRSSAVERHVAIVEVEGSTPFARSSLTVSAGN